MNNTHLTLFWLFILPSLTFGQEMNKNTTDKILTKANLCFEMRQYDSAVLLYKEFLSQSGSTLIRKKADKGNKQQKARAAGVFMQIANVYALKGDYNSAESWYYKALELADHSSSLEAQVYQNLGSLYFFRDNYEYAILYYQKSWIIRSTETKGNSAGTADLLTSLGTAYSGNGEYRKSLSCFHKADSVLRISKLVDPIRLAGLNLNIGEVLVKLDATAKALNHYRAAGRLATGNSISSINILISSNEGMAECYSRLGKVDSAMGCLKNCLKLIMPAGTNLSESARIYLFMGEVQARQGEWERSIKYYNKALVTLQQDTVDFTIMGTTNSNGEAVLLDLYKIFGSRGRSYLKSAIQNGYDTVSLTRSYHDFLAALKICDHISQDFGQGASRLTFDESVKSILAGAIESGFLLKMRPGTPDFDELFSLADASKNRMLTEALEENRFLQISGVPDTLSKRIRELKDDIVFYSRKYIDEEPSAVSSPLSGLNELQNKVIDLKLQLDSMRKMTGPSFPDYLLQRDKERKEDHSLILKYLRQDEAMLEYLWNDSVLYIFLVRQDGSLMKRVALPANFKASLTECLSQLKSAGIRNYSTLSRNLYKCLITPVEPGLNGIRRLIIIPDEELSLFPFETLLREDTIGTKPSFWHYLLRDFGISYHFSAEAWIKDMAKNGLPGTSDCFAGFAPGFRNSPGKPGSLNPLPFALKEVKGIAVLFKQAERHSVIFSDTSATEKTFRSVAPGITHIHIATHSTINETYPLNSALVFSPVNHSDNHRDPDDGLLHLDEISNLKLSASLVVLSACSTGEGKVTRTEGVLALTRGFYIAGASNVVYSLWSIPDHLTCDFMLDFYRNFLSGKSYSAALQDVKLKMISRPETSLPYMWAGIVLLGR
jgi:CHAT domain-containing protein/tetratricopeptide (TPR) repeat protein